MKLSYYNKPQVNGSSLDTKVASLNKEKLANNHNFSGFNDLSSTQKILHIPSGYKGCNQKNVDIPESYKGEETLGLSLMELGNKISNTFNAQPTWAKVSEGIGLSALVSGCVSTVIEEIYLGVPVVKQPVDKLWCLPASTKSVLNYYGMEITQEEIADYVIGEDGLGNASLLKENADKLGIEVYNQRMYLEEIKNEIKKGNPVIVILDYSLENKGNHFYVIDGFNEEKIRLMCPLRGFVYWSYDYIKQLNYNYWIDSDASGYEPNLYETTLVWPKDKSIKDSKFYREKAIQIVSEQTDLFDKF